MTIDDIVRTMQNQKIPDLLIKLVCESYEAGANREREACSEYLEAYAKRFDDIRRAALEVAAEHLRARGQA